MINITEENIDKYIEEEHPTLILSSVNEDEYKDVIEEVSQSETITS